MTSYFLSSYGHLTKPCVVKLDRIQIPLKDLLFSDESNEDSEMSSWDSDSDYEPNKRKRSRKFNNVLGRHSKAKVANFPKKLANELTECKEKKANERRRNNVLVLDEMYKKFEKHLIKQYSPGTSRRYISKIMCFLSWLEEKSQNFSRANIFQPKDKLTLIPPSRVSEYLKDLSPNAMMTTGKAIKALLGYIIHQMNLYENPVLFQNEARITSNQSFISNIIKVQVSRTQRLLTHQRKLNIQNSTVKGDLYTRPDDVLRLLGNFLESDFLRHHVDSVIEDPPSWAHLRNLVLYLCLLESQGQRGNVLREMLSDEFDSHVEVNGKIIICVKQHKTASSFGPAKLVISSDIAIKALRRYAEEEKKMVRRSPHFFRSLGGKKLCNLKGAMLLLRNHIVYSGGFIDGEKNLDTLTTGAIRKAFATLGQSDNDLKDLMPRFMCHSRSTAIKFYTVDQEDKDRLRTHEHVKRKIKELIQTGSFRTKLPLDNSQCPRETAELTDDSAEDQSCQKEGDFQDVSFDEELFPKQQHSNKSNANFTPPNATKRVFPKTQKMLLRHFRVDGTTKINQKTWEKAMKDQEFKEYLKKLENFSYREITIKIRSSIRRRKNI